jgi:hypothetical protein
MEKACQQCFKSSLLPQHVPWGLHQGLQYAHSTNTTQQMEATQQTPPTTPGIRQAVHTLLSGACAPALST